MKFCPSRAGSGAAAESARRSPAVLVLLALVLQACGTTPPPRSVAPQGSDVRAAATPEVEIAPPWIAEPLSPQKLKAIEAWLAGQPAGHKSYWAIEGELQLALGRLLLAQRELGRDSSTVPPALRTRIRAAQVGLDRVAANADASEGQKKRAADGSARVEKLLKKGGAVAVAPGIKVIPRSAWGAMSAHARRMDKNQGGWRRITVHHSAEVHPPDLDGTQASSAAAVRSIQKAHIDGRETGWGDIGYHFLVDPYGRVFQGRDLAWQGAHAKGDNNVQNIGVCLLGNFEEERPTQAALSALERLLEDLRQKYSIARSRVLVHCDLKKTSCPGRHLLPWVRRYAGS